MRIRKSYDDTFCQLPSAGRRVDVPGPLKFPRLLIPLLDVVATLSNPTTRLKLSTWETIRKFFPWRDRALTKEVSVHLQPSNSSHLLVAIATPTASMIQNGVGKDL